MHGFNPAALRKGAWQRDLSEYRIVAPDHSAGECHLVFSLLSNLFATLYLAVLLPVLTCFTLLYGLFGNAVAFLGNLGDALLAVLERFAGHAEAWESARLILPSPNSAILLFWFMLLFLLSHRVYLNWKPKAACSALMVAVYVLASVLPGIQQSAQVRIDFLNADGPSIVVCAENGNCALLGTAAGRNSAEYIVKNGLSVQYALCISKDEDSIKGIEQLNSYGCAGEVLADPQVARVLGERSGIVCTQIEDFSIALSPALPYPDFLWQGAQLYRTFIYLY